MKRLSGTLLGLVAFALSARLGAVGQGHVVGKVTDSTGNPIEGVVVTVTSPALKTLKITVKTDKSGGYNLLVNDATLRYHVKFEAEGYRTAERDEKFSISGSTVIDEKLLKTSEARAAKGSAPIAAAAAPSSSETASKSYNEGVDLWNAGDKEAAEKKFQEAVSKNPDLPQAWQLLARIAYDKKDWARTLDCGQKALDLDPSATDLYSLMANAATNAGDHKAAALWQSKFAEANPDSPEILYNKGIAAYNKKNLKEAEGLLTRAVEAKPDFALAHFWLGMTSFTLNKKSAAKDHLEKYLELDPHGSEAATAKEILPLLK